MEPGSPYIITIVGPESSGKSTLAQEWSQRLGCPWVPEFAREYLQRIDRPYTLEDLEIMAEGQWERIKMAVSSEKLELKSDDVKVKSEGLNVMNSFLSLRHGLEDFDFSGGGRNSGRVGQNGESRFVIYQKNVFKAHPGSVVVIDSGMLSLRMWARIKYGVTIPLVEEVLSKDITSIYLLMRPLEIWESDPIREAPSLLERAWIYNQYADELARMMLTRR